MKVSWPFAMRPLAIPPKFEHETEETPLSTLTTCVQEYSTSHLSGVSSNSVRVKVLVAPEKLFGAGLVCNFDTNENGLRQGLMKSIVLEAVAVATVGYDASGYVKNSTSTEYGIST